MTKQILCPICEKKPAVAEFRPFCSKRCADVDLSRWLSDSYAIPGQSSEEAEENIAEGLRTDKNDF